ncbi:MAG TPA: DNA polymerase III subunit delta' [Pelomicrobium sp.]|nr:DNA polymerase III subunit delta' [Pelomicrobium sp.]
MVVPWHKDAWQRLTAAPQSGGHAYLLHGRAGTGKQRLAEAFIAWMLCEASDAERPRPCGSCDACRWAAQGTHPDLRVVAPEIEGDEASGGDEARGRAPKRSRQQITVDQVRSLADFLAVSPHRGRAKAVLIAPAEALNSQAANALLKSLEEPPPGTVFVLVAHRPRQLPATILSRCVKVPLPLPPRAEAEAWLSARGLKEPAEWLADAGGAPLLAEELSARPAEHRPVLLKLLANPASIDPPRDGASLERGDLLSIVDWHQKWCCDLLYASMQVPVRYHLPAAAVIRGLASTADAVGLAAHCREMTDFRRLARHPLNPRLFCEDLLGRYRRVFRRP